MKITLIGMGCGPDNMTLEALGAIKSAGLLLGARRLLSAIPDAYIEKTCRYAEAVAPQDILAAIQQSDCERACVLLSGDSGFYSGARRLLPLLADHEVAVLPGISSLQLLAARLQRPWQDWKLCSAHGVECDPVASVCEGRACFFLTGGSQGPAQLCAQLRDAGLGQLQVIVGENLGCPDEAIRRGDAAAFAELSFAPLSVLLTEPAPGREPRTPGLPDRLFERMEKIPMTKQEVRAVALSKLSPGPEDVCWDIGAGSGSVGIELALQARAVWAVERDPEALTLAERNRERLGAWNLRLVAGEAPEALMKLPRPNLVFVGGSGGKMREILQAVHAANPAAHVCVSAIALESAYMACTTLEELGWTVEITQLAVSRSRAVGELHMMLAQNPVFLIVGGRP